MKFRKILEDSQEAYRKKKHKFLYFQMIYAPKLTKELKPRSLAFTGL
jgi:hypothetical protein